jgi:hypothetical protein
MMQGAKQGFTPEANSLDANAQIVQKWVLDQGLPRSIPVHIALSPEGEEMLKGYLVKIQASQKAGTLSSTIGVRLERVLGDQNLEDFTPHDLIDALLKTKNMLLYAGDPGQFAPQVGSVFNTKKIGALCGIVLSGVLAAVGVLIYSHVAAITLSKLFSLTLSSVPVISTVPVVVLCIAVCVLLGMCVGIYAGQSKAGQSRRSIWTGEEYRLLAEMTPYVEDVKAYSEVTFAVGKEHETAFAQHIQTFRDSVNQGMLFLCPNGVMLGGAEADLPERLKGQVVNQEDLLAHLEEKLAQRILPGLLLANSKASEKDGFIYVTPKLGAIEFAGSYADLVQEHFESILKQIISKNIGDLDKLRGVVLASDRESEPEPMMELGSRAKVLFRTLPWNSTGEQLGLFSTPESLFPSLFSDVEGATKQILHAVATAADPLSWVGNTRYFGGSKTAEGGMAACCDVLFRFIGDQTPSVDVVKAIHGIEIVRFLEGCSLQLRSVFIKGEEDPDVRLNNTNNVIDTHGEPRPRYNPTWVSEQQSALHSKASPQASRPARSKVRPAASDLASTDAVVQAPQPPTAHEKISTTQQRTGP